MINLIYDILLFEKKIIIKIYIMIKKIKLVVNIKIIIKTKITNGLGPINQKHQSKI